MTLHPCFQPAFPQLPIPTPLQYVNILYLYDNITFIRGFVCLLFVFVIMGVCWGYAVMCRWYMCIHVYINLIKSCMVYISYIYININRLFNFKLICLYLVLLFFLCTIKYRLFNFKLICLYLVLLFFLCTIKLSYILIQHTSKFCVLQCTIYTILCQLYKKSCAFIFNTFTLTQTLHVLIDGFFF